MARLVISNYPQYVEQMIRHNTSVGFSKHTYHKIDNDSEIAVFNKLCIDHTNFLSLGDDFVSCIGTYFYKGEMNQKGLELIYSDFLKGKDIVKLRSKIEGIFVLTIKQDNKLYVIGDELGVHYLYYNFDNRTNQWIVGNSLYEMAKVAPFKCHVKEYNMIEESLTAIIDEETMFMEFSRILHNQYIVIDTKTNTLEVQIIPETIYEIDNRPLDIIVQEFANELERASQVIQKNFAHDDVSICMTGGLDARTTLATLLHAKMKPHLYLGIGNSDITKTFSGDLKVDEEIYNRYDLPLTLMDYSTQNPIYKDWDKCIEKYGLLDHFSTSTPNLKYNFESIKESLVYFNMWGELFRNPDAPGFIEHSTRDSLSIEELIEEEYPDIAGERKRLLGEDYPQYLEILKAKYQKHLKPYLNKEGRLPVEYFPVHDIAESASMHAHKLNMLNQHRYCISVFTNAKLCKYAFLPISQRNDAKIQLGVIKHLQPSLLEIPIFSRCRFHAYNPIHNTLDLTTSINEPPPQPLEKKSRTNDLRKYLRGTVFYEFVREMVYRYEMKKLGRDYLYNDKYRGIVSRKRINKAIKSLFKEYKFMYVRPEQPENSWHLTRETSRLIYLRMFANLGIKKFE